MTKKKIDYLIIGLIVVIHTLVLYKIFNYPKTVFTYGDELIYFDAAKSLHAGSGILVHGSPHSFLNLAYSFFLMPFFSIADGILRMKLITLGNAFLMSVYLIPVWLICRELKVSKLLSYVAVVIMMFWPDILITGTLMSENLYWSLALFSMFAILKALNTNGVKWHLIASVLCVLAYWCKEVGICLALAYFAVIILMLLFDIVYDKKLSKEERKQILLRCVAFMSVFAVGYVLFFKLMFRGMESNYADVFEGLSIHSKYTLFFFIYSVIYYLIVTIMVFGVVPVLFPASCIRKLDRIGRIAYIYIVLFVVGTIMVICYTISTRSDLGNITPRIHLRYYAPVLGMILPVFFSAVEKTKDTADRKNLIISQAILTGVFCIFVFTVYKGVPGGAPTENLGAAFARHIVEHVPSFTIDAENKMVFISSAIILGTLCSMGCLIWITLLRLKHNVALIFAVAVLMFLNVYNWREGKEIFDSIYRYENKAITEMTEINEYINSDSDGEVDVFYASTASQDQYSKIYDTYYDGINNFQVPYDVVSNLALNSEVDEIVVKETTFVDAIWYQPFSADEIDYVIQSTDAEPLGDMFEDLELIEEVSGDYYLVYKNRDSVDLKVKQY